MPMETGSAGPTGTIRDSERPTDALDPEGPPHKSSEPALPREISGFRILRRIGAGGMGVVYAAEQTEPRRLVALKVIGGGHESLARPGSGYRSLDGGAL